MAYMDNEQDDELPEYQDVGGFKVKVPGRTPDADGATQAPPTQPAQQPHSGDDTPALTVPGSPRPNGGGEPVDLSATTRQFPPAPPSPQQTYGELLQKRAQIGSPIPIRDSSGKMDPKYKMGIGSRLLGSLANFGSGITGHGPVANVGPGATNARYAQDEAQRQGNVENLDTQIKQGKDLATENRQLFDSANKQAYESQVGAARGETAAAQQETSSARTALAAEKARSDKANEDRKVQEDQNTPAPNQRPSLHKNPATGKMELMQKTKGGQWAPYGPKTAEEGALLGDPNARAMFNYMHRKGGGKDEDNPELNGMSAAESRDFKAATRQNDLKMKSLMDSRRDALLIKPGSVGEIDKQVADLQNERDQIRDGIVARRPKGGKIAADAKTRTPTAAGGHAEKSITRAEVQALATKNGVAYDAAEKQFTGKGYKIK